jgi:microcystin-dependent protein
MTGGLGTPWVGEIRMVGFNFAPVGWQFCDGQLLPITENAALFNLIGTTFGGDGESTFALPDLRGRVPIGVGQGAGLSSYVLGELTGVETVTLTVGQIPSHTHVYSPAAGSAEPTTKKPDNAFPTIGGYYASTTNSATPMGAPTLTAQGGGQPHTNVQPFLAINFIISLFGIFPSQN